MKLSEGETDADRIAAKGDISHENAFVQLKDY